MVILYYKIVLKLFVKGCNKIEELLTLDMSMDIDPEDLSQQWIDQIKDLL